MEVLKTLPDQSIHCCVTSPPYFNLRDYQNAEQIGFEASPDKYVEKIVRVFREVKRVLRDDGTLWLNLGDSYAAGGGVRGMHKSGSKQKSNKGSDGLMKVATPINLKTKDLIGIPWRVAFALQDDGWYLRQDIIWHKTNPMPESVTDRCTKSHEYIFLLSKSKKYYYDNEAIKEPVVKATVKRLSQPALNTQKGSLRVPFKTNGPMKAVGDKELRNKRSVWTVTTKPFKGTHFAVFPPDLIEPCVLAGCPEGGVILDPFGGAGTTALVAAKHHRVAALIELNQDYMDIAVARYRNEIKQMRLCDIK